MTDINIKRPVSRAKSSAPVRRAALLDGIRKTRVYRIIPRIIDTTKPLRVPLPPRVRMLRPMLSAAFLIIVLAAGWVGLAVSANRTLSINALLSGDVTTIPFPNELELIGPIPLSTQEPDAATIAAAFTQLLAQYRESTQTQSADQIAEEVSRLRSFFADKKSPLANDQLALEALAQAPNKSMIIALSFVESNFCKQQLDFNCSGIGGASHFRHYSGFDNWVWDLNRLLERRYKGLDPEEMNCYYVQPCNANWVRGIYDVLRQLKDRGIN